MVAGKVLHCLVLLRAVLYGYSFQHPFTLKGRPLVHVHWMQSQSRGREQATKRRSPANKRQAIKWVVQGVERCLADQQLPSPPENNSIRFRKNEDRVYTYKRREDASLVDALYLLVNAKNQKEVLDAGKRIEVLMRVGRRREGFPVEVTERVIKATASTGLLTLSLDLLRRMISDDVFPSSIAYIAVMNALRKNGRVSQMEELLTELAGSSRKLKYLRLREEEGGSTKAAQDSAGVDIVAFNSFIAALGDAAVKGIPYSLSSDESVDETKHSVMESTDETSPSEKYLYKAINLLKGDVARRKFELVEDPDIYSYNSILAATAKCSRSTTVSQDFYQTILDSCLKGMKHRNIQKDSFTYNAMIEIALQAGSMNKDHTASKVLRLIDAAISLMEINQYTINLALIPLLRADRRHELMKLLRSFYKSNSENSKLIASAFEAFLNTLVQNNEAYFAREIFDVFFLSPSEEKKLLNPSSNQFSSRWLDAEAVFNAGIAPIQPTTRHFNILFSGYSKMYRPISGSGRDASIPIAQNAYSLLDDMLRVGVPLDKFTVSSLMAFPTSSKDVTLLWKRIELDLSTDLSPAAYRSIITAYGKASDASSACWVFFGEMREACDRRGMSIDSWNVLLGALADSAGTNNAPLDPLNSAAARRQEERSATDAVRLESNHIFSLVIGKTCDEATLCILDAMRSRKSFVSDSSWTVPKPNSQSYCQIARAQSTSSKTSSHSVIAMQLFNCAKEDNAHVDGRFLNALIRCFADDIDGALNAWKTGLAGAAVSLSSDDEYSATKRKANLAASYNGLMYVCGRAIRPGDALKICYAMKKAGVEPNEIALNSYLSGKRVALSRKGGVRSFGLTNQIESLLTVECTKYTTKDKRRANDKRIRIILS